MRRNYSLCLLRSHFCDVALFGVSIIASGVSCKICAICKMILQINTVHYLCIIIEQYVMFFYFLDNWQQRIFEFIDPAVWPAFLGGQAKDKDGNEKMPSKVISIFVYI